MKKILFYVFVIFAALNIANVQAQIFPDFDNCSDYRTSGGKKYTLCDLVECDTKLDCRDTGGDCCSSGSYPSVYPAC